MLVAAAAITAGCGSSSPGTTSSSSAAPGTTSTTASVAATTSAAATSTKTTATAPTFSSASNCQQLMGLGAKYAQAMSAASTGGKFDLQAVVGLYKNLADAAPAEIRPTCSKRRRPWRPSPPRSRRSATSLGRCRRALRSPVSKRRRSSSASPSSARLSSTCRRGRTRTAADLRPSGGHAQPTPAKSSVANAATGSEYGVALWRQFGRMAWRSALRRRAPSTAWAWS